VVWQAIIFMKCVLCRGVAACFRYGVCILWRCGSINYKFFVYSVGGWQRVIGMVCVYSVCKS